MDNARALAARRLSAALGRKVRPDEIEFLSDGLVSLGPGRTYILYAGNVAYVGQGQYMKNGMMLDEDWVNHNDPPLLTK